jgi:hypothetical protein
MIEVPPRLWLGAALAARTPVPLRLFACNQSARNCKITAERDARDRMAPLPRGEPTGAMSPAARRSPRCGVIGWLPIREVEPDRGGGAGRLPLACRCLVKPRVSRAARHRWRAGPAPRRGAAVPAKPRARPPISDWWCSVAAGRPQASGHPCSLQDHRGLGDRGATRKRQRWRPSRDWKSASRACPSPLQCPSERPPTASAKCGHRGAPRARWRPTLLTKPAKPFVGSANKGSPRPANKVNGAGRTDISWGACF